MEYNLITNELPKEITLQNGERIALYTWTARAIDAIAVLMDKDIEDSVKASYIVSRLTYASTDQCANYKMEIFQLVLDYLKGAPNPEYEPSGLPYSDEPSIYWNLDAPAITASFRQAYGISLADLQKMHWWEFKTLLMNIPSDTRMGSLMATRARVIPSKAKGEEKLKEEKIKKAARPKDTRTLEQKEADAHNQLASIL